MFYFILKRKAWYNKRNGSFFIVSVLSDVNLFTKYFPDFFSISGNGFPHEKYSFDSETAAKYIDRKENLLDLYKLSESKYFKFLFPEYFIKAEGNNRPRKIHDSPELRNYFDEINSSIKNGYDFEGIPLYFFNKENEIFQMKFRETVEKEAPRISFINARAFEVPPMTGDDLVNKTLKRGQWFDLFKEQFSKDKFYSTEPFYNLNNQFSVYLKKYNNNLDKEKFIVFFNNKLKEYIRTHLTSSDLLTEETVNVENEYNDLGKTTYDELIKEEMKVPEFETDFQHTKNLCEYFRKKAKVKYSVSLLGCYTKFDEQQGESVYDKGIKKICETLNNDKIPEFYEEHLMTNSYILEPYSAEYTEQKLAYFKGKKRNLGKLLKGDKEDEQKDLFDRRQQKNIENLWHTILEELIRNLAKELTELNIGFEGLNDNQLKKVSYCYEKISDLKEKYEQSKRTTVKGDIILELYELLSLKGKELKEIGRYENFVKEIGKCLKGTDENPSLDGELSIDLKMKFHQPASLETGFLNIELKKKRRNSVIELINIVSHKETSLNADENYGEE